MSHLCQNSSQLYIKTNFWQLEPYSPGVSVKRDGRHACLQNLTYISAFTFGRSKWEEISSQLYYGSFQCGRQHLKRRNRYSSSKLRDFCIHKANQQYLHPESIHAFHWLVMHCLSLTKSDYVALGIVEFIFPLQAVAVTYVHKDSEKRLLSGKQKNIISKRGIRYA